jgi:hypothetical protein
MFININLYGAKWKSKMKSYIKIYGPPILKAIKALEKIALDMPEVCIMDSSIVVGGGLPGYIDDVSGGGLSGIMQYFGGPSEISEERCETIISKSGESLGEYDFYFEWFKDPDMDELNSLIEKIDKALTKVKVKYTITTK